MRRLLPASIALLVPLLAFGADQALLGKSLVVKSPPAGAPGYRKIVAKASASATLSGDPTTPANSAGAVLQVAVDGATPSNQTFVLRAGPAFELLHVNASDAQVILMRGDPAAMQ